MIALPLPLLLDLLRDSTWSYELTPTQLIINHRYHHLTIPLHKGEQRV